MKNGVTEGIFSRLKSRASKGKGKAAPGKEKTHTLFSTGILAQNTQKNNEYFGGDSTVVSAGDEVDESEGEEDESEGEVRGTDE